MNAKVIPEGCVTCDFDSFVKNHYFTGKMMGAAEFITESRFHEEKLRLHEARLHGWGVVCGLLVLAHPNIDCRKRYVRVEPGSAVDCCGRDILVGEEEMLDLLSYAPVVALAKENPHRQHALGVCIRFAECPTENVPVLYDDCGCDDDGCAPNRILESYAIDVLVDPPLAVRSPQAAATPAAVVFMRSPQTGLGATTPRFGIAPLATPAAGGDTYIYAVDAGQPTRLIAFDLSTLHATTANLGAAIYGLASAPAFGYAATGPVGAATTPVVQIASPGAAAPAPVAVTGTAAADVVVIVGGGTAYAAIVYDPANGSFTGFAPDAVNGLGAATALGSIAPTVSSLVTSSDGKSIYAIDSGSNIQVISFAGAAPTVNPLPAALPAGANPSGLGYFSGSINGTAVSWLIVLSRTGAAGYIVDLGSNAVTGPIAFDHPPEFVAVTAGGLVNIVEEDGGAQFLQTIDAAGLVSAQPVIVGAARQVPGTGLRLVTLEADGTAAVLAAMGPLDGGCADLLWAQLMNCGGCGSANCLTLATIERYQANASVLDADPQGNPPPATDFANQQARIDNREGRRILASTATLQAWIECLQTQGARGPKGDPGPAGPAGPPGLGLYPDLPKIIDVAWTPGGSLRFVDFYDLYLTITSSADPTGALQQAVLHPSPDLGPPPLTLYFNRSNMYGISQQTFTVSIDAPLPDTSTGPIVYLPLVLKMYGQLVAVPGPIQTPHSNEQAACAWSFLPSKGFFTSWPINLLKYLVVLPMILPGNAPPRIIVELHGDFVYGSNTPLTQFAELSSLDAKNIGGQVGVPSLPNHRLPVQGGNNPSGNMTQGGLFEGWFFLNAQGGFSGKAFRNSIANATLFKSFGTSILQLPAAPPDANLSSQQELTDAGIPKDIAAAIVADRNQAQFTSEADLQNRLHLSDADLALLMNTLSII